MAMVKNNNKNKCNENNKKQSTMDNTHKIMRYIRIPPPQTRITIINILNNTLMTTHTSFKNTLSKQRPHLNGGLSQTH